jgi:hypothetical protein
MTKVVITKLTKNGREGAGEAGCALVVERRGSRGAPNVVFEFDESGFSCSNAEATKCNEEATITTEEIV